VVIGSANFGWVESDDAAVLGGAGGVRPFAHLQRRCTSVIALFALVMGGHLRRGVHTAVEAAGVGAFGDMGVRAGAQVADGLECALRRPGMESARTTSTCSL